MVHAASTLTECEREHLAELSPKYQEVFSTGERPLSATTLIASKLHAPQIQGPLSVLPRPLMHVKREDATKIVREGISNGILTPSDPEWASAIVLVPKANDEYRLCVDL